MDTIFKLPIEYITCHKIDDVVRKDLEIFSSEDETQPQNLYKKLVGDSLLIDKWSSLYTTDRKFLKDTQKCIKKYNMQSVDTDLISKIYDDFISETNFVDKYQYIGFQMASHLNKSSTFLHCLGLYNLGAPIFSLLAPLVILIIPFVILKAQGIKISINRYIHSLKDLLKNTSIYKLFSSEMGSQQRVSTFVSIFIYFLQVYNNIISCISFYNNINVVYKFLTSYHTYLIKTNDLIYKLIKVLSPYKSYTPFVQNMINEQLYIQKWIQKLEVIYPTKYTVVKIGQLGILMQLYYELFTEKKCRDSFNYTLHLHQFNDDMISMRNHVKNKKLGKCKFSSETNFKGLYYLAHIQNKHTTNDVSLKKNILLSGPNASGKTTILKSILLNVLLSQHIGYGCYSKANICCYDIFHSYLNIPDTSGRDSLFQAEARRCQNIMNIINENKDKKHLCIFDELMSGTNPTDAIACAEIYLKEMNAFNNQVDYIITTHYIQLCESFDKDCNIKNMKMNVNVDEDNIEYLYKIDDGISYVHGGKHIIKQMKEKTKE
jgi:energy-coupling factor transporter ATP-binding protein EcfA2